MSGGILTMKKTAKKHIDMHNANIYVAGDDYGTYRQFLRLEAVRASHELSNICTSEALELMGPETQEDREYNPNGYERFRFRYTPSTCDEPATFESVAVDLYKGFTGTTYAWRWRRYPHVMLCAHWGMIFFVLLIIAPFCVASWPMFTAYASTTSFMGPFSIAATVFQVWYDEWLKKKDLETEYYSKGEDKWY